MTTALDLLCPCSFVPASFAAAAAVAAKAVPLLSRLHVCRTCSMPQEREAVETAYHTMSVALAKSGRHILFSMCSWGAGQPWQWAQGIANSWRVSPDLFAAWDRERAQALHLPSFLISVMEVVEIMAPLHKGAQPGSFNDGDMLVVVGGSCTCAGLGCHAISFWALTLSYSNC